ncbi:Tripartite tricarboxylate transporter TctB family [endosymbiont of Ridgeia piscesae]|jgi:hypothetical protein|uniref:Tripartite tricarboxylate transporter TctB family n=4 Tax=endosymbiont of Ridgeia piscesae TaxID=54398 RepID=A0A0T5YZZ7_9GAMM|nr:tripartite tricarboxylate transporter TctB family protein [endosymbiont of Ridgeia piscesae]KRT56144.1 Tripartite tricarboxylate transporter TctB family [endosymbiont of Ridgeia piscesae]
MKPPLFTAIRPYLAAMTAIFLALTLLLYGIPAQIALPAEAVASAAGPDTWPRMAALLLLLAGIADLILTPDATPQPAPGSCSSGSKVVMLGGLMALYPWLFEQAGFLAASVTTLVVLALLCGEQRPSRLLRLLALPALLYLLGSWLGLPMQATIPGGG